MLKNQKKGYKNPLVFTMVILVIAATSLLLLLNQKSKKNLNVIKLNHLEKQKAPPISPTVIAIESVAKTKQCDPTELSYLPIKKILSLDFNLDKEPEHIYLYAKDDCHSDIPVTLKIFEGKNQCLNLKYSYPKSLEPANFESGRYNQVQDLWVEDDFWDDRRKVAVLLGKNNFCGSGTEFQLLFFTFDKNDYKKVEGPRFSENDFYIFYKKPKGKYILIGSAIWAEGEAHFDEHRYLISLYQFSDSSYQKKVLGETKKKYMVANQTYQEFVETLEEVFHSNLDNLSLKITDL